LFRQFLRWILGDKLANAQLGQEKYNVFWGMPILASDAISSVAYAVDEMLYILVPVIGALSYLWMPRISAVIIMLLFILTFSYRQTIAAYPNGGGAYVVASDNLGRIPGLVAGASLAAGYTLTVAVSIAAGTAAITSAFPALYDHRVIISLVIIALMVVGNLRGVRESARIFSIPTYAFILVILALVITGLIRYAAGYQPEAGLVAPPGVPLSPLDQAAFIFLILRAFSSGCASLTGVEAVSNAVPNFEHPSVNRASQAYILLALAVFLTFSGVAWMAKIYQAVPDPQFTVTAQLAYAIFGRNWMFFTVQATTTIILAMAANTAFAGFPILLSVIAQDRYAPRQLALRGHRLNFSNGILALAAVAAILIIIFQGDTHLLIPLYAVGVFASFTLSQSGMLVRWLRQKGEHWHYKAFINGLGAAVTLLATLIIAVTKFTAGAWIVIFLIPLLVWGMMRIHDHYNAVARHLNVPNEELPNINFETHYSHHVIVPIDSLNTLVIGALRYARSLGPNVEAFHVEPYAGEADKLRRKWEMLKTDIPLIIRQSPYREVVGPLVEYIKSEEHSSKPGDIITVLLPQFIVKKWWDLVLHNNTSVFIANALFHEKNIVVSVLPSYLEDIITRREKARARREVKLREEPGDKGLDNRDPGEREPGEGQGDKAPGGAQETAPR
jgi:amino acid transporter